LYLALVSVMFNSGLVVLASSAGTRMRGEGQIAFVSDRDNDRYQIFMLDVQRNLQVKLSHALTGAFSPAWSEDGHHLVFLQPNVPGDLYIMKANGSDAHRLTSGQLYFSASWSPDGRELIVGLGTRTDLNRIRLRILNIESGQMRLFPKFSDKDAAPDWSPDGKHILFLASPQRKTDLYVVDSEGDNLYQLTNDPATDFNPAWSPDGKQIAFASDRDGDYELYLIDVDGDNLYQLTNDPATDFSPAWSPDGKQIAFSTNRDGNSEIYMMNADGSDIRRLTTHPSGDFMPVWWP
jgi:Tol biopolymer transport system component